MARFSVASLFSGCGGKDLGFISAGFHVEWANDFDRAASETYRRNIGPHIVCKDIRDVRSDEVPKCDVVIGGFPCQGFSIVGSRRLNDERNFLYRELKRIVGEKQPAFFIAENVRGLMNMAGGKVISAMIDEFRELGYKVDYKLLNARDFGTPQHRERVFIIGNRLGLRNPFPIPTHALIRGQQSLFDEDQPLNRFNTLRDAIGDLGQLGSSANHEIITDWIVKRPSYLKIMQHLQPGQKLCNVRLGPRSVFTWDIPEVFGILSHVELMIVKTIAKNRRKNTYGKKDGNPLSLETIRDLTGLDSVQVHLESLLEKKYLVQVGDKYELKNVFNGLFRRLRWDEPCEAVLTVFSNPRYYVHPSENRPFSVREVARIQDFPDDFVFYGSLKDQYTQVGNAVPSRLAAAVARQVFEALCNANIQSVKPAAASCAS